MVCEEWKDGHASEQQTQHTSSSAIWHRYTEMEIQPNVCSTERQPNRHKIRYLLKHAERTGASGRPRTTQPAFNASIDRRGQRELVNKQTYKTNKNKQNKMANSHINRSRIFKAGWNFAFCFVNVFLLVTLLFEDLLFF